MILRGGAADINAGGGPFGYGGSRNYREGSGEDGGGGGGGYEGGKAAPDFVATTGGTSYVNTSLGTSGSWQKGQYWGDGRIRISLHGYYIQFNKNVPSITESVCQGVMPDQYMIYGIADTLRKNTYSLKGYIWQGWTEYSNGTGEKYEDQQLVINR